MYMLLVTLYLCLSPCNQVSNSVLDVAVLILYLLFLNIDLIAVTDGVPYTRGHHFLIVLALWLFYILSCKPYLGWPMFALLPLVVDVFAQLSLISSMAFFGIIVQPSVLVDRAFGYHEIPPKHLAWVIRNAALYLFHLGKHKPPVGITIASSHP